MQTMKLTDEARRQGVLLLQESADGVRGAVKGLSPEQWRFHATPTAWAPADIVEHLVKSEQAVFQLVTGVLVKQPARGLDRRSTLKDSAVIMAVHNRDRKFQAAELVRPTREWTTTDGLLAAFQRGRQQTIDYLERTDHDLRGHLADHPVLGMIDAFQWLLFLAAHTDRHMEQLKDVMQLPAFPRR